MAKIKVNYYMPEGTYQYAKITYKKDTRPESVNDGTLVNIDVTKDSVDIDGLDDLSDYWFAIFTDVNQSEAVPFSIGPAPPAPTLGEITLLKGGSIKRDDSLLAVPYVASDYVKTAYCNLTGSGYELYVDDDSSTTHSFSNPSSYRTSLTSNYSTNIFKPVLYTGNQEYNSRAVLKNKVRIKCNAQITIPPTDSGFRISPVFSIESYAKNSSNTDYKYIARYFSDQTHVTTLQTINSSPTETVTINETGLEFEIEYWDYNTETGYPELEFTLNAQNIAPFSLKVTVTEITAVINEVVIPRDDSQFNILTTTTGTTTVKWTISELEQVVSRLGFNCFLLEPKSSNYSSTRYYVIPFNITMPENLYTVRDRYITDADNYYAFGLETNDTLSGIPVYCSDSDSLNKSLVKTNTSTSFNFSKTKDGHSYKFRRIAYASGRQSFVFHATGYNKIFINNKNYV